MSFVSDIEILESPPICPGSDGQARDCTTAQIIGSYGRLPASGERQL